MVLRSAEGLKGGMYDRRGDSGESFVEDAALPAGENVLARQSRPAS